MSPRSRLRRVVDRVATILDRWGPVPIAIGGVLSLYHLLRGDLWTAVVAVGIYSFSVSFLLFHRDRLLRESNG